MVEREGDRQGWTWNGHAARKGDGGWGREIER